jgi:Tfp pilus assembly protein PilX
MLRSIAVFVGVACLAGCASAPVQEMSDARQAITAARVAGATEVSSLDFYAAQAAITRAEKHLEAGEYARARLAAMEAKRHAGAALVGARRADGSSATTPGVATPGGGTQGASPAAVGTSGAAAPIQGSAVPMPQPR